MGLAPAPPDLGLRDSDAVDCVFSAPYRSESGATDHLAMPAVNWVDLFGSMDRFLLAIAHEYGHFVYLALGLIFLLQTGLVVMAFLPGDSLLFVAGAVAAGGHFRLDVLVVSVVAGAVLGNLLNFRIGRWLGRKVFDRHVRWINPESLKRTQTFFEHHGGKTVMVALFVPVLRSFAPLVAGAMSMQPGKFNLYSVLGAFGWVTFFTGAGYFFGNLPLVRDHLGAVLILGLIGALLGPVLVAASWRLFTTRVRALRDS
jgi:membrane-associated protein